MTVDRRTDIPDAGEITALWTGLLLAPIAFLIDLELAYALVPPACSSRNTVPVHLVHLACLLLALSGGFIARRWWTRHGAVWPDQEGDPTARSRFMAGAGMLLSSLFALVIVAMWLPSFILDPCQ